MPTEAVAISPPAADSRVWAAVVCFGATANDVKPLVAVLAPQVERVLVLDNSPALPGGLAALAGGRITYLPMPGNLGTAGAMNEAWRQASQAGANYVIGFDQDSQPPAGLVGGLLASLPRTTDDGRRVAAIGPAKVDRRTGRSMRVLLPVTWTKRYAPLSDLRVVEVDHLISSGCLIDLRAFQEVGPYDEALFVDYVDIEWCLRARGAGFAVVCAPSLSMPHAIGVRTVRVGPWSIWVHSARRNGLLVRNHLLLWRSPAMATSWLLGDLRQVIVKLLVQVCAAPPRFERLLWIARGVRDGLLNRGGPF